MSDDDVISVNESSWFSGTTEEWEALDWQEQRRLAFAATGCLYAWPSWKAPVDCSHLHCHIRRGELHPISAVNDTLRHERDGGWLRFVTDRNKLAAIFRAVRVACMESGVYDAWQVSWRTIVYGGIFS